METKNIDELEVSELGFTGSRMYDMNFEDGHALMDKAIELGINIFDTHHRYGNADKIIGSYKGKCLKMAKISALKKGISEALIEETLFKIGKPDIMWISDINTGDLYNWGEKMYESLKGQFSRLGVTSESADLILKFKNAHPDCKFFMVPVHRGDILVKKEYLGNEKMFGFIEEAKNQEKFVFGVKPFCEGLHLDIHGIKDCLKSAKESGVDCLLVSARRISELEQVVKTYENLG